MSDNVIEFTILGKDELTSVLKAGAVAFTAFYTAVGLASKAIIDVGAENEKMSVRMNAMLGSVAEGNKVFEDMTKFAGEVPFAYDEIMQSATTLSGVLRGGSDEINEMMPMIADLAAVSGLSIRETTDQIVRMYSAGAGAADLFRERGINAMLGFKAGVSVTAEETMERVVAAYEDADSKFRGAAQSLATTWDGIMSMIGDKYRAMKVEIADAGLFNFFKAFAMEFDSVMSRALENTAENAGVWANFIIESIRSVMNGVAFLADSFRGLEAVWVVLKLAFAKMGELILNGMESLSTSIRELLENIPWITLREGASSISVALEVAKDSVIGLKQELLGLASEPLPSEMIDDFMGNVEMSFMKLQEETEKSKNAQITAQEEITAATLEQLNERFENEIEKNEERLELLIEYSQSYEDIFNMSMERIFDNAETLGTEVSNIIGKTYDNMTKAIGRGVASAIVDGKDLSEVMKSVLSNVLKQIISMFVTMGIQRLVMTSIFGAASAKESSAALAGGFAQTYTNAFAATAAIPIVGPVLAPGVAAGSLIAVQAGAIGAMASGAGIGATVGVAHGGFDNIPAESSFLIKGGERVLSPNQNEDLTEFLDNNESSGGNVTIENLEVIILPNATNADALLSMSPEEMEDVVAGPIINALNSLTNKGINPEFIERSL